jgi:hypothetical protein
MMSGTVPEATAASRNRSMPAMYSRSWLGPMIGVSGSMLRIRRNVRAHISSKSPQLGFHVHCGSFQIS